MEHQTFVFAVLGVNNVFVGCVTWRQDNEHVRLAHKSYDDITLYSETKQLGIRPIHSW